MAPTGSAASNIQGSTIHSKLEIIVGRTLNTLNLFTLNQLQSDFANCNFIIIDEVSMLGCSLLKKIDIRCRESKARNDVPFGGMFIYLIGGLKQLPPVNDRPLYGIGFNNCYCDDGQTLFRNIECSIILSTSHRQAKDFNFKELLNRLGNGTFTLQDYEILKTRKFDCLNQPQIFRDSIRLFPTRKAAFAYNVEKLREFESVFRIKAINDGRGAETATSSDAENLEPILYLAIGAKVMLNKNLWISVGLVNGATSIVTDIVLRPDTSMPMFIMVNFDKYIGPRINNAVPIAPFECKFNLNGHECKRIQIPLNISFAITIHKSQGLTLDSAVVDIGDSESNYLGLSYVALSRVRSINNLALTKVYDYNKRFKEMSNYNSMRLRNNEIRSLINKQI